MPHLNWSPDALAVVRDRAERQAMTRLFDAYFRVADERALAATVLHLNLPGGSAERYNFRAEFRKEKGWVVHAKLKREYLILR